MQPDQPDDVLDRLLSRFEDASIALHTEQTRSAQERWEAAGDAIRAEIEAANRSNIMLGRELKDARAEGRRQATEGWEREWLAELDGTGDASDEWFRSDDEGEVRDWAADRPGSRVSSRLVGPWETAEQPEPAPLPEHPAIDDGQFQREVLGIWPPDVEPREGAALGVTDEQRTDHAKTMGDIRDRWGLGRRHDPGELMEEPDLYGKPEEAS